MISKMSASVVSTHKGHNGHFFKRTSLTLLRLMMIDLPLLLLFTTYVGMMLLEDIHTRYFIPLKELMVWDDDRRAKEVTFYHYICDEDDITAESADELIIDYTANTPSEAVEHMQIHGASIYPSLLNNETMQSLRDFIVEENLKQEGYWVIEGNHRYSFGIHVDQHPSVTQALQELGRHTYFNQVLEELVGRNPAVIEFTAITSTYGATMQFHHQDVLQEGSAAKYARSFVPSYSLFIPLQDTTQEMGATEICAGTQTCGNGDIEELCLDYAFPASSTSQNKWPAGWGALVNQQTTHRGTAHTDPHGPERVVFILTFAPRPQYALPGTVESRIIGQGGSYSMHWHNWGHTWNDFTHAADKMKEPWRSLRALGIYKPQGADWGWDWPSVAWMRIANGDNGYNRDNLEQYVEKGGFPWIPKWLHADILDEEEIEEEEMPDDGGWHHYIVDTFQNVKRVVRIANQYGHAVFGVGLLLWAIVTGRRHQSIWAGASLLSRNLGRLFVTHGVVLGLALFSAHRISQTSWARHIQTGKLFQPYSNSFEVFGEDNDAFTLPSPKDVLVTTHYQSKYLASYAHILEYNQPGNAMWDFVLEDHADYYDNLTPALQVQLCDFLITGVMLRDDGARILHQTQAGSWIEMPKEESNAVCHKRLVTQHDALMGELLHELEFLIMETKFGAWRDKSIYLRTIPEYLDSWIDKLWELRDVTREITGSNASLPVQNRKKSTSHSARRSLKIPTTRASHSNLKTPSRLVLTIQQPVEEPWDGAWLHIGETVEGRYECAHDEWYKATVIDINTDRDLYDLAYDDGEENYGLFRECVRRYQSFVVGEEVEARTYDDGDETFHVGRIVAHDEEDGTYSVRFTHDHEVWSDIAPTDLRRYK